jgi:hypothetical protein
MTQILGAIIIFIIGLVVGIISGEKDLHKNVKTGFITVDHIIYKVDKLKSSDKKES